jgi:hypothetical protein
MAAAVACHFSDLSGNGEELPRPGAGWQLPGRRPAGIRRTPAVYPAAQRLAVLSSPPAPAPAQTAAHEPRIR